jgi:hypothetical protein
MAIIQIEYHHELGCINTPSLIDDMKERLKMQDKTLQ